MNIIHGSSHEAIAHFRGHGAALAVYWIYISRLNTDNVAWPSLRGLAKNTGYSVSSCQAARRWLVKSGALEKVKDYIRPQWRGLDKKALAQKQNFDRSEYYRPTGFINVDGKRIPMLYVPQHEQSTIEQEEQSTDVLMATTSVSDGRQTELDVQAVSTELNTNSPELNSNNDVSNDTSERAQNPPPKSKSSKRKSDTVPREVMNPMNDAIISAFNWSKDTMPKANWSMLNGVSKQLCNAGYKPGDIPGIYAYCKQQNWSSAFTPMALVTHAPNWRATQPATTAPNEVDVSPDAPIWNKNKEFLNRVKNGVTA